MKILHIGPDSQFVQFISKTFEFAAPGCSDYVIISKKAKEHLDYKIPKGGIKTVKPGVFGFLKIVLLVRKYDVLIAHSLTNQAVLAFLVAPKKTVRVWSGWGFDYYTERVTFLLGGGSKELYKELGGGYRNAGLNVKVALKKLLAKIKEVSVARVDYFSAPIPNDFLILKRNYPQFRGEYSQLNYASVEDTFSLGGCSVTGGNILLGNSASITNNHIEVLERIKEFVLEGRKVVVPLSYGDKRYRDSIVEKGRRYLGDFFYPLIEFMPLRDYSQIINSCGLMIMAHKRQQALGNICSGMYKGARIILDEESPVYQFFIERGAVVNSLNDLGGSLIVKPLQEWEIARNRNVIQEFWGREKVKSNTNELIEKIKMQQKAG